MNHGVYDDVALALRKQAFVCRNEHGFLAMERDLVANAMWCTSFGQNSLNELSTSQNHKYYFSKYPPPVVPPQKAFMNHAEASYHVPGQSSINMWVCNSNKFLWCKKDLTWPLLVMSLFTSGSEVHFRTTSDLIQCTAILEHWKTFEKSK